MAAEAKRPEPAKVAAPQNKRAADIEALAAALYGPMLLAERGTKVNAAIAQQALTASRDFYKVCDNPEV